jgi:phosphoribosyl-ATP pyrophosphohydrolase
MRELRDHVGGFLVTFVEREGRLEGIDLNRVKELVAMAWPAQLTVAGGVTTAQDVADIHTMGADAQVGMALYTGRFDLANSVAACLTSDRADALWPTVVVDESGIALGLAYSDLESLRYAIDHRCGAYHSRSRGGLWIKGATSGAMQSLLAVDLDCDADTLRFTVRQGEPGFCHENTWTCWGEKRGLHALVALLNERLKHAPDDSYTARLFREPVLLRAKLKEEAGELADAVSHDDIALETADVLFFAMVAMTRGGITLEEVERVLDRRALRLTRRPGNAKLE